MTDVERSRQPASAAAARFAALPSSLAEVTRFAHFPGAREGDDIPMMIAHPDWTRPAPVVVWMHGRTVQKEIDPGRYLRWIRAGIAAVAIDLPGHGERLDRDYHRPENTLRILEDALPEVNRVVACLGDASSWKPRPGDDRDPGEGVDAPTLFDRERLGIGGMSAGGMVTLRRLCDEHPFVCAAVESTAGSFDEMPEYKRIHGAERVAALDASGRLDGWRPIPLLALHSLADEIVPAAAMTTFVDDLRARYREKGADASSIELKTWETTGAPSEHAGFGRVAADAKLLQVEFLRRHLIGS